jgi:hypothetical protein
MTKRFLRKTGKQQSIRNDYLHNIRTIEVEESGRC